MRCARAAGVVLLAIVASCATSTRLRDLADDIEREGLEAPAAAELLRTEADELDEHAFDVLDVLTQPEMLAGGGGFVLAIAGALLLRRRRRRRARPARDRANF